MAWNAELVAVNVGTNAVSIRVEITNDEIVIDPGPPIKYLSWSISRGYTSPDQIVLNEITAWIHAEIIRVKNLYNAAQILVPRIGTVITE